MSIGAVRLGACARVHFRPSETTRDGRDLTNARATVLRDIQISSALDRDAANTEHRAGGGVTLDGAGVSRLRQLSLYRPSGKTLRTPPSGTYKLPALSSATQSEAESCATVAESLSSASVLAEIVKNSKANDKLSNFVIDLLPRLSRVARRIS